MSDVGDIRESHTVERYDGSNFLLWKMHMRFIFQSRDMFSIVNGMLKKSSLSTPADQLQWEKKDKQAIVAILGIADDVVPNRPPPTRFSQRQSSHRRHKGKKSQAHITTSSIHSDTASNCSSASSEAYCVNTTSADVAEDTFWFADSGATEHMTDKRQWFTNFQSVEDECWTVTVADNNVLYVRGIGDIHVKAMINGVETSFCLKNVLYVP